MNNFNFYEVIDDAIYNNKGFTCASDTIAFNIKKEYYDFDQNNKIMLIEKQILGNNDEISFKIENDSDGWKEERFFLGLTIELIGCNKLFGKNAYVNTNSIVGIGLEYKNKKSKLRHGVKIGSITSTDNTLEFSKKIQVDNTQSDIDMNIVLYIEKSTNKIENINFANKKGLVVARFNFLRLIFDGDGSMFPISLHEGKDDPLWEVALNYTDIYEDDFSEDNLCILINKKHKDYGLIQIGNSNFNKAFQSEVMSSAVAFLIFSIIKKEDFDLDYKANYAFGSIMQVLKYFNDILDFDLKGDFNDLLISIKKYFDKGFNI